jgi:hypothetical protein
MAHVVRLHKPRPGEIDDYIAYLIREWQAIPEVAAAWDQFEEPDRLDFVLEWPIKEDRLQMLRRWAKTEAMTPDQCGRFAELLEIVDRQKPLLQQLLDDQHL